MTIMKTPSIPTPSPNRMPGYTGECALPPSSTVSAIGYSGIRYYPASPEKRDSKDPGL